jgi:23S rRNA (guanosine2251-2'-O)-methyltransferase
MNNMGIKKIFPAKKFKNNLSKINSANNNQVWIYGKHPVFMAIANHKRKIYKIIISKNNKEELEKFLSEKQIRIDKNLIEVADNNVIASNLPEYAVHQGFALKTSPISFGDESNFINKISDLEKNNLPLILILDGLTDPHNIGAIIRSAAAFGVKNIVVSKHNFPKESSVICKSSSGMIEICNLIIVGNLNNFLADLKKIGYWCIGLDGSAKSAIGEVKDYKSIALIVGSEGNGIKNLVKKNCDLLVKIPINSEVESLNASNAVAISLYEITNF